MHIEARLFEILTAFFAISATAYGVLTGLFAYRGIEWAGTVALALSGGLSLITGTFFRFVARRLDTRPEDYEDAEISDGAGELGFYSPHSWWPVMIALSASVTAWLRTHHLPAFTCALLDAQPMGFYSPATLVEDARRHGVLVRTPCIAASSADAPPPSIPTSPANTSFSNSVLPSSALATMRPLRTRPACPT